MKKSDWKPIKPISELLPKSHPTLKEVDTSGRVGSPGKRRVSGLVSSGDGRVFVNLKKRK